MWDGRGWVGCSVLQCNALYYNTVHCIAIHYTVIHCTALQCIDQYHLSHQECGMFLYFSVITKEDQVKTVAV